MGELSQQIGKKLELYANDFFNNLNWRLLGENIQIDCIRNGHMSQSEKQKNTHGIDLLVGFANPFSQMKEAAIIECKNRKWKEFTTSNLNLWINELVNTIECAAITEQVTNSLENHIITTGILLYNSSDGLYDREKAKRCIEQIEVPRKKSPLLIYIADCSILDRWDAMANEFKDIKMKCKSESFGIIYPSINGSVWEKINQLTPTYIFSDYILSTYTIAEERNSSIHYIDIKAIFCFDTISNDSFEYLHDMISKLQLEYRGANECKFEILFYPNDENEIILADKLFKKSLLAKRTQTVMKFLRNRNIAPVSYTKRGE